MQINNSEAQTLVRFTWMVQDDGYTYMDTWEMTPEEWAALTPQDIETRQQEQYAAWRAYMANPGA